MSNNRKRTIAGVLGLLGLVLLVWIAIGNRIGRAQDNDEEEERPIQAPSRVSIQNGQAVITFDAATAERMGLKSSALQSISAHEQTQAPAFVLPLDDLANLRAGYVAAQAKVEIDRAGLEATRKEDDRLKLLYGDNQDASLKAVEAQDAALKSNQAEVDADQRAVAAQSTIARLQWGLTVADWVQSASPELDRVLDQQELLVQVTLPFDQSPAPPPSILLEIPNGKTLQASLISAFPRVDPRIQGRSFLYRCLAMSGLAPGTNLVARLSVGVALKGVLVPDTAVVWWQGKPWVYVEVSPEHFVRREVPMGVHLENGWFTNTGFLPGDRVVTLGPQSLLSEEFRSQIPIENE